MFLFYFDPNDRSLWITNSHVTAGDAGLLGVSRTRFEYSSTVNGLWQLETTVHLLSEEDIRRFISFTFCFYLPIQQEDRVVFAYIPGGGGWSGQNRREARHVCPYVCVHVHWKARQGTCWPTIVTSAQSRRISVTPRCNVSQGLAQLKQPARTKSTALPGTKTATNK